MFLNRNFIMKIKKKIYNHVNDKIRRDRARIIGLTRLIYMSKMVKVLWR